MEDFIIRTASISEINLMLDWGASAGWNPGIYDALPLQVADPHSFFIGILNGDPIGSISAVRYSNNYGYIGLFFVKKEFRGNQYARKLTKMALENLKNFTIGVDAAMNKKNAYKKIFNFNENHLNIRYQGNPPTTKLINNLFNVKKIPVDKLIDYDGSIFPSSRPAFLTGWLSVPERTGLVKIKDDHITGYGVIRACRSGHRIGPLFANDFQTAEELFLGLCHQAERGPIAIDVPDCNNLAIKLVEQYGFKPLFENARLYKNGIPKFDLPKIYGVATLEIG